MKFAENSPLSQAYWDKGLQRATRERSWAYVFLYRILTDRLWRCVFVLGLGFFVGLYFTAPYLWWFMVMAAACGGLVAVGLRYFRS